MLLDGSTTCGEMCLKRRDGFYGASLIAGVFGAALGRRMFQRPAASDLHRGPAAAGLVREVAARTADPLPPIPGGSGYNTPMQRPFEEEPLRSQDEVGPPFAMRWHANVMAMNEESQSDAGGTPGAPVFLDERNEWQVQGIVRHDQGTIRLSDGVLVVSRTGVHGWVRRERWSKTEQLPLDTLKSVRISARGRGRRIFDMELHESSAGKSVVTLKNCRPMAALRALVEQVETASGSLKVEWANLPAE